MESIEIYISIHLPSFFLSSAGMFLSVILVINSRGFHLACKYKHTVLFNSPRALGIFWIIDYIHKSLQVIMFQVRGH